MNISEKTLQLAVAIQQIPAPTFQEQPRAAFIAERFNELNLADIEIDSLGNVYARRPGAGEARPVILSAHSDTVFSLDTNLSVSHAPGRIQAPGIGDNSLGVAGLFGLLWLLDEQNTTLPGDLWLVVNVGEEGLGDLNGMRTVVERFDAAPLAYLVLEGMALGQVYHRGLGVQRYRVTAQTQGGHSWADYGKPSAIHELAALVGQLTQLQLPQRPRTTLNVGVIAGGTSINTIAAEASFELDLRSEEPAALQSLVRSAEILIEQANRPGVQIQAEMIGQRPAGEIPKTHPLPELASQALQAQGIQPQFNIGSTDANIPLSRGLPCVCIGLTRGGGAHTVDEYIETAPLQLGLEQLFALVTAIFKRL
ncbi:MAG: M20/M25/M40 family metallo-hydrolase [Chloroflexi bacterium]|jgi:tripeptide aminopeptidase|nr:M20/M25/M40 family metallo-hydrolase [Chloroflexota bacterium]